MRKEKSGGHGTNERPAKPKKSGKKSDKKQPKTGRGRIEHTSLKRQTAKKMKKGDKRTPEHKEVGISMICSQPAQCC